MLLSRMHVLSMSLLFLVSVLLLLPVPGSSVPPLIAYTGQPLDLSAEGLRSVEANKAARYAAQQILLDLQEKRLVHPCHIAVPEIIKGTSKVVAGIQYNFQLRLQLRLSNSLQCRSQSNAISELEEVCQAEVVYQPYKPAVAVLALINYSCDSKSPGLELELPGVNP